MSTVASRFLKSRKVKSQATLDHGNAWDLMPPLNRRSVLYKITGNVNESDRLSNIYWDQLPEWVSGPKVRLKEVLTPWLSGHRMGSLKLRVPRCQRRPKA